MTAIDLKRRAAVLCVTHWSSLRNTHRVNTHCTLLRVDNFCSDRHGRSHHHHHLISNNPKLSVKTAMPTSMPSCTSDDRSLPLVLQIGTIGLNSESSSPIPRVGLGPRTDKSISPTLFRPFPNTYFRVSSHPRLWRYCRSTSIGARLMRCRAQNSFCAALLASLCFNSAETVEG